MSVCEICGKSPEELDEPCETCGQDYIIATEMYEDEDGLKELDFNASGESTKPNKEVDDLDYDDYSGC